jgi:hypothetical protein
MSDLAPNPPNDFLLLVLIFKAAQFSTTTLLCPLDAAVGYPHFKSSSISLLIRRSNKRSRGADDADTGIQAQRFRRNYQTPT